VRLSFEILSAAEATAIHDASVAVLGRTGMRFGSAALLDGLARAGARVDHNSGTARIPASLVEASLEATRSALATGRRIHLLNGVTSERGSAERGAAPLAAPQGSPPRGAGIHAKMSGGCERILDWDLQALRAASEEDLRRLVILGEKIPEVAFVGNPVVLPGDERMRRIRTAALVAKLTSKVGSMEIWDERDIDVMAELGTVVRGSRAAFLDRPCLLTAKETISPLFLDAKAGAILLGLAARGLPCTIIPMPIAGLSAPASLLGAVVVANAESLGTMCAIRSVHPEALVGAGVISGILDMRTGAVSFSAPEAVLQDLALADLYRVSYGMDFLIGSGYTDAKYPSSHVLAEKALKFLFARLSGRGTHPVGLLNAGSVFSAEQAFVDLEICRAIHAHLEPKAGFAAGQNAGKAAGADPLAELVSLIDEVGPRGSFAETAHTLAHFREQWLPRILDRTGFVSLEQSRGGDPYRAAHAEIERLLAEGPSWEIGPHEASAIDGIVAAAEKSFS
jgi:trimethylamine--corrinoid protein Co-methyltransferase